MTVRNITTRIAVEKTIMEIEQKLVKYGVVGVLKEYSGQRITCLSFGIKHENAKIPFKLPINVERARAIIVKAVNEGKLQKKYLQEPLRTEQAERVSWRIVKDWIDSQLSLVEINYADMIQIFLPYVYNPIDNKTMYQSFIENKSKFIPLEYEQNGEHNGNN